MDVWQQREMANHLHKTRVREEHLQGTFTGPPLPSYIQHFLHIHVTVSATPASGLALLVNMVVCKWEELPDSKSLKLTGILSHHLINTVSSSVLGWPTTHSARYKCWASRLSGPLVKQRCEAMTHKLFRFNNGILLCGKCAIFYYSYKINKPLGHIRHPLSWSVGPNAWCKAYLIYFFLSGSSLAL